VTDVENEMLEAPFTEEEVRQALFKSYADGSPSPDGIPFFFYQKFWYLVKDDIMAIFADFHSGKLDIYRLNFAMLSLIPKEVDAKEIKKFRHISLLNCIFKLFTKVITNRLGSLLH
jgi:hypothetical protein